MVRAVTVIVAMVRLLSVALSGALTRSLSRRDVCLGHVDTTPSRDRAEVLLDVDVELSPACTGTTGYAGVSPGASGLRNDRDRRVRIRPSHQRPTAQRAVGRSPRRWRNVVSVRYAGPPLRTPITATRTRGICPPARPPG